MYRSYIWPLLNRVSHILLILFFAIAYILSGFDDLIKYHGAFGILVGVLFLFRFIWGFVGPKYSKFKDFDFSLAHLKDYMLSILAEKKEYIGHNPASSFAIIFMMILSVVAIASGLVLFGVKEDLGIFSYLHDSLYESRRVFKEIHELFANLFVAVIIAHVLGALIEKFLKHGDAIDSMIDGYKTTQTPVMVKLNFLQKIFSLIWMVGIVVTVYYVVFTSNILLG